MTTQHAGPAGHAIASVIDAFHLPGLEDDDIDRWESRSYGVTGTTLRFPILREGALTRVLGRLEVARAGALERMHVREVARIIGRAAARLADAADPLRRTAEEALPAVTGYSLPMIRLVLDRATRDWSERSLLDLVEIELPGGVLDRFTRDDSRRRRTRALGPRLAFHVFAGNVPGIAVTSLVRSLLVRAATLGKTAAGDPLLPVLFTHAIASVDQRLADCIALTHWTGGLSLLEDEAMSAADVVVVYGGAEAVRSVRSRAPATARVVEHGPRVSIGLVGCDALRGDEEARAVAARVAWAASVFDQQGCVSPHIVYVEDGGIDPRRFASLLGEALDAVAHELPRGSISAAEAAAIHDARTTAEFRTIAGEDVIVIEGDDASWTVIFDSDPGFDASCLNRTVRLRRVDRLEAVPDFIEPVRGFVQTAAIAGAGDRLTAITDALARAGVTRITDFPRMPWPPPEWHHDGASPLRELVRWVDLEL